MLWIRLEIGTCQPCLPDVVVHKVLQNDCYHVHELSNNILWKGATFCLASFPGLSTIQFLIAIKNWTMGRPGNEATFYHIQAGLLQNVRISHGGCLHRGLTKPQNCQIRGWAFTRKWALAQNSVQLYSTCIDDLWGMSVLCIAFSWSA